MCESFLPKTLSRLPAFGKHPALWPMAIAVATAAWLAMAELPAAEAADKAGGAQQQLRPVGVAKIDITPTGAVLLTGYASRKDQLTQDVAERLWARLSWSARMRRDRPCSWRSTTAAFPRLFIVRSRRSWKRNMAFRGAAHHLLDPHTQRPDAHRRARERDPPRSDRAQRGGGRLYAGTGRQNRRRRRPGPQRAHALPTGVGQRNGRICH